MTTVENSFEITPIRKFVSFFYALFVCALVLSPSVVVIHAVKWLDVKPSISIPVVIGFGLLLQ